MYVLRESILHKLNNVLYWHRLCKNSVFAVSEYYPQSGMQDIPDNDRIRCDLYVGAELGF